MDNVARDKLLIEMSGDIKTNGAKLDTHTDNVTELFQRANKTETNVQELKTQYAECPARKAAAPANTANKIALIALILLFVATIAGIVVNVYY